MANTLLTPTEIAKEALFQLENFLVMAKTVHRAYEREYRKIGDTLTIRKPVKFTVTSAASGTAVTLQDVTESSTTIKIDKQKNVAWLFNSNDLTLTIEEYSERYIKPAMIVLANQIDLDLMGLYIDIWNSTGTAETTPSTFANFAEVRKMLNLASVPLRERYMCLDPAAEVSLAATLTGLQQDQVVKKALREAYLGSIAGMDLMTSQNVKTHTAGDWTGTVLVNDTVADGDTVISLDGFTSSAPALKKGDIFTIANVNMVNPVGKQAYTNTPQRFVVTADNTGSTNAVTDLAVSPSFSTTGPGQTIDALPADNAAITVASANGTTDDAKKSVSNIGYHKNAFALVMAPMQLPDGASWRENVNYKGISIRLVKDYDISKDQETIRLDILYGIKTIYPELGCRLLG